MPHLELLSPGRRHTRFDLVEGRIVVGRHPGCDVVLDEAAVSRQHAALVRGGAGTTIEDLHSRNGTFVNGQPLTTSRLLVDGDEISICGRRLRYVEGPRRRPRAAVAVAASSWAEVILENESAAVIVSQLDLPGDGVAADADHLAGAKLRAVVGLNRAVGTSLTVGDVLPRLLEGLLEAFPRAERGFVLLVDPATSRLVVRSRLTRSGVDEDGPLRLSLSLLTAVAESRRAILSADATEDTRFSSAESVVDCRIRSVMCVPVARADGGLLGVIQIDSRDAPGGFASADLEVLAGVAGQAAQAIDQALAHDERIAREQFSRDLELAQRVQQGLLPSRPPDLPGYEIFDHYESARHVGGDFFAYVPLADDRLAVVLADVSGKGVSAALLMAALSADVRYCLASERDLGRAVARINETFLRGGWDDRFATLVVAVLDPARHVATICNAGHLPVFRCGPRGEVEAVAADLGGLPLGMAPPGDYRSCEVPLAPGTSLLFCTDGISEALDHEQRCYGFERMEAVLAEAAGPAEIGRRLLADVRRYTAGEPQSDDICVVCVGRSGGTAHPAQRPGPERDGGIVQARG